MRYKYITENNLKYPQNYMYAPYGGADFLTAYLETRQPFLTKKEGDLSGLVFSALRSTAEKHSKTNDQLLSIFQELSEDSAQPYKSKIDWYVQRFEVRKRLFPEYDLQTGKPIEQSGYDDVSSYMLLSAVCGKAYAAFGSLKYLNCFLKLNDTLISLAPDMVKQQILLLRALITLEVSYVEELASHKGIGLKGGASLCS